VTSTHDVISDFLDDRPFDPEELAEALDDPRGRALLIDLIVLRRIVQPAAAVPTVGTVQSPRPRPWRVVAAAAALVLALTGGYLAGGRRAETARLEAPAPTRVVEAVPFKPAGAVR
jgi:hypothetical protein